MSGDDGGGAGGDGGDRRASRRAPRRARKPPARTRVAVPCCACGEPTGMKVAPELLEEVEIFELCKKCR